MSITLQAAQTYGANAAPLATSASSLGVTTQPATTQGNTTIPTGYSANPAAGTVTGGGTAGGSPGMTGFANSLLPGAVAAAQNTVSTATGQPAPALTQAQQQQTANSASAITVDYLKKAQAESAARGGTFTDALKSGVSKIAAFAQQGMADIQAAIQGEMNANGGDVPPAKMQYYTMQMSKYELLNQMAAKIQEKEERAVQIWLQ